MTLTSPAIGWDGLRTKTRKCIQMYTSVLQRLRVPGFTTVCLEGKTILFSLYCCSDFYFFIVRIMSVNYNCAEGVLYKDVGPHMLLVAAGMGMFTLLKW